MILTTSNTHGWLFVSEYFCFLGRLANPCRWCLLRHIRVCSTLTDSTCSFYYLVTVSGKELIFWWDQQSAQCQYIPTLGQDWLINSNHQATDILSGRLWAVHIILICTNKMRSFAQFQVDNLSHPVMSNLFGLIY